jgi:ABC-type transport system involved in multi-copper enzyme maturation permease subunit
MPSVMVPRMGVQLKSRHAISRGVAAVATDVESGRAEMLYTAPLRRTAILNARILGWVLAQAAVLGGAVAGALLRSRLSSQMSGVSLLVPLRVGLQFVPLVFFFAAVAFAASARARTRGVALGVAVGVAAGSYLANLVALLWSPLGSLRHLDRSVTTTRPAPPPTSPGATSPF